MKTLLLLPALLPTLVFAETAQPIQPPAPVFFDTDPADNMPSENLPESDQPAPPAFSDGLTRGNSLEAQINRAMLARDWPSLPPLLTQYEQTPDYDTTLYRYALGALRRSQMRHDEAVSLYRDILDEQPGLVYPRFDLGVMLFENKQYREAAEALQQAQAKLPPAMHRIAGQYLAAIQKAQSWQPDISLQYEQTDNVNNAADARTIDINGQTWQKTADSLPQSVRGIRYGLGISREKNLRGNHFARLEAQGSGVHYWDNQEYNEQTLRLAAGYRFQNSRSAWGIMPFAEQNWLGGGRYSRVTGAGADYSRRLNNQWRLMFNGGQYWKRYQDERIAARYNSRTPYLGATLLYAATPAWLLYGGLDWNHELTRETEQASVRKGLRIGTVKTFSDGLGIRANLRYGRRTFDAPGLLVYEFKRKDHEYQANAALWHNKIQWKGLVPQLNFRYQKTDSNMSGFYSRKNTQWFMSVEKRF
ncbi:surface lipoprotein assembly modifier [Bergeriella denitrificans]|uniref:Outer membrane protein OmpU n=1 Tax=Bergeriella denitrificans TaxID=494 RepID=A0A378UEJ7_BERDE|nr:surface lipoprotein assembly modifier [Bergeriella denitrificans]STZ75776.1 outer membrane protein OmpU [Bergeriella denitrificans]